ncbi:MAG: glutathione S-transferase family protein [Myxococcota bacterium]
MNGVATGGAAVALVAGGWWLWERGQRRTAFVPEGRRADVQLPHTESFELYHNAFSMCSKKVRVCLAELGVPYRSHPVDLIETGSYANLSRGFLKVNPGGTVPVLVHDGSPIYESHAQIRYLAEHAPAGGATLFPEDAEALATMQHWVDLASIRGRNPLEGLATSAGSCATGLSTSLLAAMATNVPVQNIAEGLLFHPHPIRPAFFFAARTLGWRTVHRVPYLQRILREAARHLDRHLDTLEAQLDHGAPYIQGERFTLADVSWMALLDRLRELALVDRFLAPDHRPRVAAYWAALQARPSHREAILDHVHPLVTEGTARLCEGRADAPWMTALVGQAA